VLVTVFDAASGAGVEVGDRLCVDSAGTFGPHARRDALVRAFGDAAREALRGRRSAVHVEQTATGRVEALVEYLSPTPCLVIFGAGSDAVPVVRIAQEIGWRVVVLDHRPGWARAERFPAARVHTIDYARLAGRAPFVIDEMTAAIVMTHHFLHDLELVTWLPRTPAFYIGMLGPKRRTARLFEEASRRGRVLTAGERARIWAPIGLDLASETPAEIALAAIAEIRAVLAGREGGFLRNRSGPLHDGAVVERGERP
jgi:xanthine/CO dehydrogenase XdhC/CoxF family maturation factor